MRKPELLLPDLRSGGRALCNDLEFLRGKTNLIILAVAKAGVPVAVEVAKHLALPLDIICLRRLLIDPARNSCLCAVNIAGNLVVDDGVTRNESGFQFFLKDALQELAGRVQTCRGSREPLDLRGKSILLVDNGISTGQTILSVIRPLRKLGPSSIILAIPVAATELRPTLETAVDQVICRAWTTPFGHVGLWYRKLDVPQITDISALLNEVTTAT